jgi:autotransporter-associated beta strand protein
MLTRPSFAFTLLSVLLFASVASLQAQVVMTADNGFGATSFTNSTAWSPAITPTAGSTFTDVSYRLRTPAVNGSNQSGSYLFQGDSLTLSDGGQLFQKSNGTLTTSTITVAANQNGNGGNGLTLDAGIVDTGNIYSWILAGQVYLTPNGGIIQANQPGGFTTTIAANVTSGNGGDLSIGGDFASANSTDRYVLSGSNNYAGATRLLGGAVQLANSAALPTGTSLVFGSANNASGSNGVQAATLDLNGNSPTIGGLGTVSYTAVSALVQSSTLSGSGNHTSDNVNIYSFSALPAGIQIGQKITGDSGASCVIGIDSTNNYVITNTGITVGNGHTMTFQATSPTGTQAVTNGGTANSIITVNGTTAATSQIYNFTGNISNGSSGSIALVVNNGWQELSGSNTYSGTASGTAFTQVTGGVLDALYPKSLPGYNDSTKITVSPGAALVLGVGGALSFASSDVDYMYNNVIPAGANLGFDSSAGTGAFNYSTNITNSIGIVKWGAGAVNLTGSNSFNGPITVNGGTLAIAPAGALAVVGSSSTDVQIAPNQGNVGTLAVAASATLNANNIWVAYRDLSQSGMGNGTLAQTGGLINVAGKLYLGGQGNAGANISNGTLNIAGGVLSAINNNSSATANISGGRVNILNGNTWTAGQYYQRPTTLNLTGGILAFYSDSGATTLGGTGGWNLNAGTSTINLGGGVLATPQFIYTSGAGTVNFNGGTLQTTASSSDFLLNNSGIGTNIQPGGAVIDTFGNAVTINNSLNHYPGLGGSDGGLTLKDSAVSAGTLTLTGVSNYNGPTNVLAGTLVLGSLASLPNTSGYKVNSLLDISSLPSVTIGSAQTLTGTGAINGTVIDTAGIICGGFGTSGTSGIVAGKLTFNSGNLSIDGGTVRFNVTGGTQNSEIVANGGLSLDAPSLFDVEFSSFPLATTTYTVASYAGTLGGSTANVNLATNGGRGISADYSTPGLIKITYVPGSFGNLTWASTSNSNWDVKTTLNWNNPAKPGSGANDQFFQGDNVTFADAAGLQTNIQVNSIVLPSSVMVTANSTNYTIASSSGTGQISGNTSLTLSGNSTLTVSNNNNYSGATSVYAGTLLMNGSNTLTGNVNVYGGTLSLQGVNTLSGTTSISNGKFLVGSSNNFNGPINVTGGLMTVQVAGNSMNAPVSVSGGSLVLQGNSTFNSTTAVGPGVLNLAAAQSFPSTGPAVNNGGLLWLTNSDSDAAGGATVTVNSGGTLQVGDNATVGAGILTAPVVNNGVLQLNRPDADFFTSNVSGSGNLVHTGSGITTLSGGLTYTGSTIVSSGTLQPGNFDQIPHSTAVVIANAPGATFAMNGHNIQIQQLLGGGAAGGTFDLGISGGGGVTFAISGPATSNFGGTFAGANPFNVDGGASVTLTGSTALTGAVAVLTGNLTLTPSVAASVNMSGTMYVAADASQLGSLNIGPGTTINCNALGVGGYYMGGRNGGYATVNQTGGVVNSLGARTQLGGAVGTSSGDYNISGGTWNTNGLLMSWNFGSSSSLNVSGSGVVNFVNSSIVTMSQYYGRPSIINQSGGQVIFYSDSGTTPGGTGGILINGNGAGNMVYNLNGGTLNMPPMTYTPNQAGAYGGGSGVFNFNGGVLQTSESSGDYLLGLTGTNGLELATNVGAGGAIIDTQGNDVTINNNLLSSTGTLADGGLKKIGAGTLTLAGTASTYDGGTFVSAGTLIVTNPGGLADGSNLTVGSSGFLDLPVPGSAAQGGSSSSPSSVPEPGTLALLTAALAVASAAVFRRSAARQPRRWR